MSDTNETAPTRIVKLGFYIEDNGVTGRLAHVELDRPLDPDEWKPGDLILDVDQSLSFSGQDPSPITALSSQKADFEVWGVRSPASKMATLKQVAREQVAQMVNERVYERVSSRVWRRVA
jgi:hypothetical protein